MSHKLTILLVTLVSASFFDTPAMSRPEEPAMGQRPPSPYLASVASDEPYVATAIAAPAHPPACGLCHYMSSVAPHLRSYEHYHVEINGQAKILQFDSYIAETLLYDASTVFKKHRTNEYYMLQRTPDQINCLVPITYNPAEHTDNNIIQFHCFDVDQCPTDQTVIEVFEVIQQSPTPTDCCTLQ